MNPARKRATYADLLQVPERFILEAQRWVVASTHGGSGAIRAEPFAAVELNLGRWWLEPAG